MILLTEADPQRLGGYWLAGRLGAGGQGVVYEAYAEDGRRVAIKVLHGDQAAQLAREVTAAQRVAAFCTAPVIEARLDGPRPYVVTEYVEGPNLREAVTEGRRFAGADLHRLATAAATALTAIHDAEVIHRDLKPDNVLLGPDGPRVIDFGIARTAEMSLTATGLVNGTPGYMAPEVFGGERAGMPADVFAWGCVILYAATGQDPFAADNLGGVMHRVLSSHPDLGVLPASLRALVGAALAKDPRSRPTARQLLLALVSADPRLDTARLLAQGGQAAAGGLVTIDDPALGAQAEQAYDLLSPDERELAPEVFLRLVTIDERNTLSARRAALPELLEGRLPPEAAAVSRIMQVFGYLVSSDAGEVWLSRPALPHAWPRYRRWIDANRDGLAVHREILAAVRRWEGSGRRDGDLFQGSSLENAVQWAATARRNITLSPGERDFLEASAALTRRRSRRTRLFLVSLAGLLVVAVVAGGLALRQTRLVADQRDHAEGGRLAQFADTLRHTDPRVAMQLSVAAWRLDPTPLSRAALTASVAQREIGVFKDPALGAGTARALSRDGRILVSAGDNTVRLWDVRTGRRAGGIAALGLKGVPIDRVALSPTGRDVLVVTARELSVWRLGTGRRVAAWKAGEASLDAAYGTVDRYLVVTDGEKSEYVWDLERGTRRRFGYISYAGAMTPSGDALYSYDMTTRRLERRSLPELTVESGRPLSGMCDCAPALRVTPDGTEVLLHAKDGLRRLPAAHAGSLSEPLSTDTARWNRGELTFSADGRLLASVTSDRIQVWRAFDELLTTLSLPFTTDEGPHVQVAFDGDTTMRYLNEDRVFTVDLSDLAVRARKAASWSASTLGPGGRLVMAVTADSSHVYLGDPRARPTPLLKVTDPEAVLTTAFGAGGRLAGAGTSRRIAIFDAAARRRLTEWRPAIDGRRMRTTLLAFSPDGAKVITALSGENDDAATTLALWEWRTHRLLWSAAVRASNARFSPDGRTVAVTAPPPSAPAPALAASSEELSLLDAASGKPLGAAFGSNGRQSGVIGAQFTLDGRAIAVMDQSGRVTSYDVATRARLGQEVRGTFDGHVGDRSPREDVVALSTGSGRIQLFDLTAGAGLGTVRDGDLRGVAALAFSADGSSVLSVDSTGALHERPVAPGAMTSAICARAGRPLSAAEWERYVTGVPYQRVCP
ncbi:protein kinase [Nonomuraea sp. SMC257]|uniref:non-specific serine/threonine protein kinase n=1 Tax=Nonomuraea montanisoli TaxID=2741721 RepID=A0A7Y6M3J5_9ACTN|nr:serine/threonine-protein kinase [Nonomuraea montanisoli]NUW33302.1 protein kinase [Nonomuraea montanisoli]